MKHTLYITSILMLGLSTANSIAQSSGSHGGDPNELAEFTGAQGQHLDSWYSVKKDLISGFERNQHLKLNLLGNNPDRFKKEILDTLQNAKVNWDNQPIQINGINRPCENFKTSAGEKRIHCNQDDYANAMKNLTSEAQYKMIAHEYFSLAGYEPNSYGSSDYPFSSQISSSLQKVEVKRWAVNQNPIDYRREQQIQCYVPDLDLRFKKYISEDLERNFVIENRDANSVYRSSITGRKDYDGEYAFSGEISKLTLNGEYPVNTSFNYEMKVDLEKYPTFNFRDDCPGEWFDAQFIESPKRQYHPNSYAVLGSKKHRAYCLYLNAGGLFPAWQVNWQVLQKMLPNRCVSNQPMLTEEQDETEMKDPFLNFSVSRYNRDKKLYMKSMDIAVKQGIREMNQRKKNAPKIVLDPKEGITCNGGRVVSPVEQPADEKIQITRIQNTDEYKIEYMDSRGEMTSLARSPSENYRCKFDSKTAGVFQCVAKLTGDWKASYSGEIVSMDSGLARIQTSMDSNFMIFLPREFSSDQCTFNPKKQ